MTLDFTILNSTIHYNTLLTILFTYTDNNTMYHLWLITYIILAVLTILVIYLINYIKYQFNNFNRTHKKNNSRRFFNNICA